MKKVIMQKTFSRILVAVLIALNLQATPLFSLPSWLMSTNTCLAQKNTEIKSLLEKNRKSLLIMQSQTNLKAVYATTTNILRNIKHIIELDLEIATSSNITAGTSSDINQCGTDIITLSARINGFLTTQDQATIDNAYTTSLKIVKICLCAPYVNLTTKVNSALKHLTLPSSIITSTASCLIKNTMLISAIAIFSYAIYQNLYPFIPPVIPPVIPPAPHEKNLLEKFIDAHSVLHYVRDYARNFSWFKNN